MTHPLQATIEELWERRAELSPQSAPTTIAAIESVIGDLDAGKLRVAEKIAGEWFTHQWIKKAVLLSFRVRDNRIQEAGDIRFFDKVDTKFEGWSEEQFTKIKRDFEMFASRLENLVDVTFIPISALLGDNIVEPSTNMPWYQGSTLLYHLETVYIGAQDNHVDPRFPVQSGTAGHDAWAGH